MKDDWKVEQFFRMWPRALFHMREGRTFLEQELAKAGVYVLYRNDIPYYIGKTRKTLFRRLKIHALKPNVASIQFLELFLGF